MKLKDLIKETLSSNKSDKEKIDILKELILEKEYPEDFNILWEWLKSIRLAKWGRWTIYQIYNKIRRSWISATDILTWYKNYIKIASSWYEIQPRRFIWDKLFNEYIIPEYKQKYYVCELWMVHKLWVKCNCK